MCLSMPSQYERKDYLYRKAKSEGLRSRANFKLQELDKKFKLIKANSKVLDLGAWPGSWLQYILEKIGPNGRAVGIDLQHIDDFNDKRVKILTGDVADVGLINEAQSFAGGSFDLIVSDMSPKLSGIREADQARAAALSELALATAEKCLLAGGSFICKTFKGKDSEEFYKKIKNKFENLHRSELQSSRKSSNEYYIIGLGMRK